ncbi:MAG: undecaprenyl-phosphate glucose phosphotransferase [Rhodocyclaceae bacterium]|nr:undecaprenyl-phosphate glucose phosphotransferase [Rhodocyclaceae bacterium]
MSKHTLGLIRPHGTKFAFVQRLLDAALILLGLQLALLTLPGGGGGLASLNYSLAAGWSVLVFLTVADARHLYASTRLESLPAEARGVLAAWGVTLAILVALAFASKTSATYSRQAVLCWAALAPLLLIAKRYLVRRVLAALRSAGRNTRTLAVVGRTEFGTEVAAKIRDMPALGLKLVGFYDDRACRRDAPAADPVPAAGTLADLVQAARAGAIDYVYIALPLRAEARISDLIAKLADTTASVYYVPNFFVFDLMHGELSSLDGIPLVSVYETPFYGVDGWVKRLEDVLLASVILAVIALPMLVIAAGVKITSPGPVLFRQRRYGLNGKLVEVWKFRSMSVCEDGDKVPQARRGDARVTPFGAFLRRTSLDELPQFFNVLQGSMSIVGPRPHAVAHNEHYRALVHGYMLRHKVKPGITGWAQINGWRGETDTLEKMAMRVQHDLDYVRRWSLLLDLKIILRTIRSGFTSPQAY